MKNIRSEFPIFLSNSGLSYLDNGATTQRPKSVIQAEVDYYERYNANIHRGLYAMSQKATDACDATREKLATLIHARETSEIVFTSGTTMGINLIAYSFGDAFLKRGDEILITAMEHHANIIPWQELVKRKGIRLRVAPLTKNAELDYTAFARLLSRKTKLVSIVHISNVLGVENNLKKIIALVRKKSKGVVLVDAAQSVAHIPIDVQKSDIDFLVASGHKMYGPTGTGFLYGKRALLESMPPFLTGGDMIIEVTMEKTTFQIPPQRFEAGTPNIAGIIGLGSAVDFLLKNKISSLARHEAELTAYAYQKLSAIQGLTIYGPKKRHGIIAFNLKGIHAHDVADIANRHKVCIRSGNHCAMPLHRALKIPASARMSLACYNTRADIDALVNALRDAKRIFL